MLLLSILYKLMLFPATSDQDLLLRVLIVFQLQFDTSR